MAENNVTKHLSKLLHCRVGEFGVSFGRFWGYLLFLDPNCYFLMVLIVCQLLEELTLQVQLKLPLSTTHSHTHTHTHRLSSMHHHKVHVTLVFVRAMYDTMLKTARNSRQIFLSSMELPDQPRHLFQQHTTYLLATENKYQSSICTHGGTSAYISDRWSKCFL
jgi:hypothetical protein